MSPPRCPDKLDAVTSSQAHLHCRAIQCALCSQLCIRCAFPFQLTDLATALGKQDCKNGSHLCLCEPSSQTRSKSFAPWQERASGRTTDAGKLCRCLYALLFLLFGRVRGHCPSLWLVLCRVGSPVSWIVLHADKAENYDALSW